MRNNANAFVVRLLFIAFSKYKPETLIRIRYVFKYCASTFVAHKLMNI
jgi:hypothetical protein